MAALIGTRRLRATWSRNGTPAAQPAALLRGLGACLVLSKEADRGLRIANQVNLGSLRLRFEGAAELTDEGRCRSSASGAFD